MGYRGEGRLVLAHLVRSSGQNILIADRMISSAVFANGVFQMPFLSIVVEEVLKRIMADIAALEKNGRMDEERIARTHIIVDITIAARWTRDNLRRWRKMFVS